MNIWFVSRYGMEGERCLTLLLLLLVVDCWFDGRHPHIHSVETRRVSWLLPHFAVIVVGC